MYLRLGFAVAIHVDPDVLLVDEVLAVGDEGFTHRCLDKFAEFKRRGKTILLVTHSLGLVERFCDEALWLDAGQVRAEGDPLRVVGAYLTDVGRSEEAQLAAGDARAHQRMRSPAGSPRAAGPADAASTCEAAVSGPESVAAEPAAPPSDMFQATEGRWGSREVEITGVVLKGSDGQAGHVFQTGEPMSVHLSVRAVQPTADFVFGIGLFNAEGVCCYGTNTFLEEMPPEEIRGEGEAAFFIDSLDLVEGTYKLDVAVHKRDGYPYDYHRLLYTFSVKSLSHDVGIYRPQHRWQFSPNIKFTSRPN